MVQLLDQAREQRKEGERDNCMELSRYSTIKGAHKKGIITALRTYHGYVATARADYTAASDRDGKTARRDRCRDEGNFGSLL